MSTHDGLAYLNVEALQELYAVHYYKVYRKFPKPMERDNDKKFLILKIRM